jgi:hypothetical protein
MDGWDVMLLIIFFVIINLNIQENRKLIEDINNRTSYVQYSNLCMSKENIND